MAEGIANHQWKEGQVTNGRRDSYHQRKEGQVTTDQCQEEYTTNGGKDR
jgi:hypothetical protein